MGAHTASEKTTSHTGNHFAEPIQKRPHTALVIFACVLVALAADTANAATKANATRTPLRQTLVNRLLVTPQGEQVLNPPQLQTAVTCLSRHDSGAAWAISSWIIGNELYKSYQDPTKVCQGSYPYTITNAHMFLQIAAPATITVALDVEQVDTTFIPGCPVPGDMVFLGDLTDITFPEAGLYDVDILFDQPVVVDGPFFLGFFFATSINAAWDLALITDNARTACVSYNIWDTAVGYIDLGDVQSVHQAIYPDTDPCFNAAAGAGCFEFDGRIILHTSGSLSDPAQCCVVAGDANHDARVNISDITFIISYLFSGGAAPSCNDEADANSDGKVNIADITGIIEFLFAAGPAPACGTSGT